MKKLIYFSLFYFIQSVIFAQPLQFQYEAVDTIEIEAFSSFYHFDERTYENKSEILKIYYSEKKQRYVIDAHKKEAYDIVYYFVNDTILENKIENFKHQNIHRLRHRKLKKDALQQLLQSLSQSELPTNITNYYNKRKLKSRVRAWNTYAIKKNNYGALDWDFISDYLHFHQSCKQLDSMDIFLRKRFNNEGFMMITNVSKNFSIKIKTKSFVHCYVGAFPNPVFQPFIDTSNENLITNLNINLAFSKLLPNRFLNRNQVTAKEFMASYVVWLAEQ